MKLSLLVPIYNEQRNLPVLYERLTRVLREMPGCTAELIFVDDGSRDESFAVLRALHTQDGRVKAVRLSRNFGSASAVLAGLRRASGDAVMWLSADLQDPPELIPQMVREWEAGADVVWAARAARDDPWWRALLARLFYGLLRRVAVPAYPPLGMDICLMARRVARIFARLTEHHRFTQALVMQLGFRQVTIPYTRERRHTGRSKWGIARLFRMAMDMLVASSAFPVRLMFITGALLGLATVVLAVAAGASWLRGAPPGPWGLAAWGVLAVAALNFLMLGVLGEYLWRVLEEVRGRPLYIVDELLGFATDVSESEAVEVTTRPT